MKEDPISYAFKYKENIVEREKINAMNLYTEDNQNIVEILFI